MNAVLLRHASAGDPRAWEGDDRLRPLDERGRRRADELAALLVPLGIRRVVSSPYARCVETVEPLAEALGVAVERDDRLAEGAADAARPLLAEHDVVACTHGDVVEALLGYGLETGVAVILRDGEVGGTIPAPSTK